jgi:7-cyano-7-deazaguanine synthase in queuosine biosynthesis
MIPPRLVLCSGAEAPEAPDSAGERKVVRLDTLGPRPNVRLRIENVTDAFSKRLSPRLVDLLEIAAYVYAADCEASRDRAWDEEKSKEPWDRDFRFVVPVRDVTFWRRDDVKEALVSALGFLSSDTFEFTLPRLTKERACTDYLKMEHYDTKPFEGAERVVMFSGGLDSLAGALMTMSEGRSLVAVSHRSAPQISKRQRELFRQLRERAQVPLVHVPVWANKTLPSRESTQRSRSFLFSALGTAVASVLGAGGVRLYENGVTSLNWPLASEVLRSRASRTTHPETLMRLQALYRLVTDDEAFVVDNPFVFMTKTEVVAAIATQGASDLVMQTSSCSHTMFQSRVPAHCGCCTQCMDRRVAILAAGLAEHDSAADYATDVFIGPRRAGYDRRIGVGFVRMARELAAMDEAGVTGMYGMELARAASCFPNTGAAARRFIEMYTRHAGAVSRVVQEQLETRAGEQFRGQLPPTSLLGMIGLREHVGESAAAQPTDQTVPPAEAPTPARPRLVVKPDTYQATLGGIAMDGMPPRAFRLLVLLAQQATEGNGGWVTRDAIYDTLWPGEAEPQTFDRQVDDTVKELRHAFDDAEVGAGHRLIKTKRRVGYRLALPSTEVSLA